MAKGYNPAGKQLSHGWRRAQSHGRRRRLLAAKGREHEYTPVSKLRQVVPPLAAQELTTVHRPRARTVSTADPIEVLGLRPQANMALKGEGIVLIEDLLDRTPSALLAIMGVGQNTVDTIKGQLAKRGLHLMDTPTPASVLAA